MNRLITIITVVLALGLVTSYAWAGEAQAGMNNGISYQELSPGAFYGYTIPAAPENNNAVQHQAAVGNGAGSVATAETNYNQLSAGEFYGYVNQTMMHQGNANTHPETNVQVAQGNAHPEHIQNMQTNAVRYKDLSPAKFYGYSPIRNPACTTC